MKKIAFVLGNGESRKNIDPVDLTPHGAVYGCNALYRTFAPKVLVAADVAISREIQESGYSQQHEFYTRRPLKDSAARVIPKPYFGYSSGPAAAGIACDDGHNCIYLLGFDLGPNTAGRFNNVYAGTAHYKPQGADPTFTGNWQRQLSGVMDKFYMVQFVRVMGAESAPIPEFVMRKNFVALPLADFVQRLNTAKGF